MVIQCNNMDTLGLNKSVWLVCTVQVLNNAWDLSNAVVEKIGWPFLKIGHFVGC